MTKPGNRCSLASIVGCLALGGVALRRPGYIISAEPSASWTRGKHTVSMSVPIAVQRNRQVSVPDMQNNHHGDASFPDYIVLLSYSQRL